jgi:hypothetical protein
MGKLVNEVVEHVETGHRFLVVAQTVLYCLLEGEDGSAGWVSIKSLNSDCWELV